VIGHRFVDEAVKFPRCRVGFNLTIPSLGVELSKPLSELREFLRGKALDQKFEFFDGAHVWTSVAASIILRRPLIAG